MWQSSAFAGGLVGTFSILLAHTLVVAEETTDSAPQVLYLQTDFVRDLPEKRQSNLLGREMIRQAILLAAREELGIPTYDQTLGETPPEHAQVLHLFVRERTRSKSRWQVTLYAHVGEEGEKEWRTIWKKNYNYNEAKHALYADMVPKLESDTREELAEALLAAGIKKEPPEKELSQPIENELLEEMLGKIDFIAQYAAVRLAHQTIASNGQTDELLGVLVRGYANLAFLTRHQYNATSDAFTARSWLYAQRLMMSSERNGLSVFALWHRAYAWALGGTLHHGLADLEKLKTIQLKRLQEDELPEMTALPFWTNLVEPYCMSDRAATKEVGEQNVTLKPWAKRLWFDLTSTYQHDTWTYHAGDEMCELSPTAYGVYAEMSRSGAGLATGRAGAFRAPLVFREYFPSSLENVSDIPQDIRTLLPTNPFKRFMWNSIFQYPAPRDGFSAATTFVAQRLREQSRTAVSGEPSWSALAYLLEEEQFVQVANYLGVSTNATEHSLAEEVEGVYPLVEKHRYAAYIDSFRYNERLESKEIETALAGLSIEDPRGNMRRMFRRIWSADEREGRGLGSRAWRNRARDFTMHGLLDYYFASPTKWKKLAEVTSPSNVDAFNAIVPYSDVRIRFSVNCARKPTINLLKLWKTSLGEDATAYTILGKRFLALEDSESASQCFEASLEILPTLESAKNLAELHWKKDFGKWKGAYLDFLQSEDLGLQHAHAHENLAYGYAYYGLWPEAREHAELAGELQSPFSRTVAFPRA